MNTKVINKAFFAVFYLNTEGGKNYDISDSKSREQARTNFGNQKKHDIERMKKAFADYNEYQTKAFEDYVSEIQKEKIVE